MKRPSLLIIFLSVFIDLIGFGIVMPMLPIYARTFGAPGYLIGMIMASFSVMQFLFAPAWGRLSDKIGRRPVLLVSNAGSAIAYTVFALASNKTGQTALLMILGSRIFAGLCGANLSVASAYIADVTPPEKRSKGMALIGISFGLGFVLGPAFASFSAKQWGPQGPGWAAAAFCTLNFLLGCVVLAESRKPGSESAVRRPRWSATLHTFTQPTVGLLVILYAVAIFAFACFETTYGLLVKPLGYDETRVGYLIAYCGLITVFVQGAIGRLVKVFGERKLIPASLLIAAVGLAMLPFMTAKAGILTGLGILAIGAGINRAPTLGLLSILTPPSEQGATLGVAQSAGSLARILAPIFSASAFDYKPAAPYFAAAGVALIFGLIAFAKLQATHAKPNA